MIKIKFVTLLLCIALHAPWKFVPGQLQAECRLLTHNTSLGCDFSLVLFAVHAPGDLGLRVI